MPQTRGEAFGANANGLRRLFAELLGTFLLVLVAVGGPLVNAKLGPTGVGLAALATAPGLMVGAVILFMGSSPGHTTVGVLRRGVSARSGHQGP